MKTILFTLGVLAFGLTGWANVCPFCSAVKQTLRQEMETMDAVAIGELVVNPSSQGTEIDGNATFRILKVLRGESLIKEGQKIDASYFGPSKSDKHFLLMGVDPTQLVWSSPLPMSKRAEEYVLKVPTLPEDGMERLKFFQKHLEDEDSLLARDAYDEFAVTPYDQIKALKPHMNREQLLKWIQDDSLTADRKRLYLTMLGVCGEAKDAEILEKRLRSDNAEVKAGLDALIACYLTLKGESGLPLIDELFLKNTKSAYAETYSAIMALRFHGTEGGIIDRKKILPSLHLILARPELADLVVPDLARWEDWSQIDRLVTLFKQADESTSWVRVPVINYMRACPLPQAAEKMKELEEIDPKAVQRAKTFFPLPSPQPAKSETSSLKIRDLPTAPFSISLPFQGEASSLYASTPYASLGEPMLLAKNPLIGSGALNRINLLGVGIIASLTLALAMWFLFSQNDQRQMGLLLIRSNRSVECAPVEKFHSPSLSKEV